MEPTMVCSPEAAKLSPGQADWRKKLITCHIGNGASITAVRSAQWILLWAHSWWSYDGNFYGRQVIDPAIIPCLMQHTDDCCRRYQSNSEPWIWTVGRLENQVICALLAYRAGDEKSTVANGTFKNGQYLTVLNGADAIIFTAGIGENSAKFIEGISWFWDVDQMSLVPQEILQQSC